MSKGQINNKRLIKQVFCNLCSYERWFETAHTPSGETHVADSIGDNGGIAFRIDAGNDDWGSWVQILGSSDTPQIPGSVCYNLHGIRITAAERTTEYFIQIAFGETPAAALLSNDYSEIPFKPQTVQGKPDTLPIHTKRQLNGTKVWARCKCPGQNTGTIDFYHGIHESNV